MSPFREITVLQSQSRNLPSGQHGPVTDQRASFTRDGSDFDPSGPGPARNKHTAKFEPAASRVESWAQMTSGSDCIGWV